MQSRGSALLVTVIAMQTLAFSGSVVSGSLQSLVGGYEHSVRLGGGVTMFWTMKPEDVYAAVLSDAVGWIGIGISESGTMRGADIALLQVSHDHVDLGDYFAADYGQPVRDPESMQDWNLQFFRNNGTHMAFGLSRKLVTCDDNHDFDLMKAAPYYIAYAKGRPLGSAYGTQLSYHGSDRMHRGAKLVNLYMPDVDTDEVETDSMIMGGSPASSMAPLVQIVSSTERKMRLAIPKTKVPSSSTSYMCTAFKASDVFDSRYHITEWTAAVNSELVHHIFVYRCPKSALENSAFSVDESKLCDVKPVSCEPFLAWGMGQGNMKIPKEAGLPFGGISCNDSSDDEDCFGYFLLEYHYNNPEMLVGVEDSSAIVVSFTSNLRDNELGLFIFGPAFPTIEIPPGRESYLLRSECPSSCTSRFPSEGINVIASQVHMHGLGKTINVQVIRENEEQEELARKNYYDFGKQSLSYNVPFRKLLPGDRLIVNCEFDSSHVSNVTRGGWSSVDEMCVAYLGYYPRMKDIGYCNIAWDNKDFAYCGPSSEQGRINTSYNWDPAWRVDVTYDSTGGLGVTSNNYKKLSKSFRDHLCNAFAFQQLNNPLRVSQFSFGSVFIISICYLLSRFFDFAFGKVFQVYRTLDAVKQRNVQLYATSIVMLTVALILLIIGFFGMRMLILSAQDIGFEQDKTYINTSLFATSIIGYLYIFEGCYRLSMDWSVGAHHICTLVIITGLSAALYSTLRIEFLELGMLLAVNAAFEQPVFVSLISYRLAPQSSFTKSSLRFAYLWTVISKTLVFVCSLYLVFAKIIPAGPSIFGWLASTENAIYWTKVMKICTPTLCILLFALQLWCAVIMWKLWLRTSRQPAQISPPSTRKSVKKAAGSSKGKVELENLITAVAQLESTCAMNATDACSTAYATSDVGLLDDRRRSSMFSFTSADLENGRLISELESGRIELQDEEDVISIEDEEHESISEMDPAEMQVESSRS